MYKFISRSLVDVYIQVMITPLDRTSETKSVPAYVTHQDNIVQCKVRLLWSFLAINLVLIMQNSERSDVIICKMGQLFINRLFFDTFLS